MSFDPLENFAASTILSPPSPATSGLSFTVQVGDGDLFPSGSDEFNVRVCPASTRATLANSEILRVTRSGDTFTVIVGGRAQEGTTARSIIAGDEVALIITKKTLTDMQARIDDMLQYGTGSPEGVVTSVYGKSIYVDISDGTMYNFRGTPGTNTGWLF